MSGLVNLYMAEADGWHSLLDGSVTTPPAQPPDDSGLPTADTTGPDSSVTLTTYSGDYTISTNGTSISGLHIAGGLTINAANVQVTDCVVDGSININTDSSSGSVPAGQTFTRVKASSAWNAYGLSNVTFDRCCFTAVGSGNDNSTEMQMRSYTSENSVFTATDLTIENCYFAPPPHNTTGSHLQAVHLMGVQHAVIRNCNMEYVAPDDDTKTWITAALYCESYDSTCQDITIDSCQLRGGGYYEVNFHGTSYVITNNNFDPDYAGGIDYPSGDLTITSQSGNTCNGQPVTLGGQ